MAATETIAVEGPALFRTDFPLPGRREGKVRDVYELPAEGGGPRRLLIVATDRISAFDVVLPTPIPGKGRLLTEISSRWFETVRGLGVIGDHVLSTDAAEIPGIKDEEREKVAGRIMIGRAARVIPIEFVA
jgi:phosphoribosylaminoimidazole-succinocarboxamide synthase